MPATAASGPAAARQAAIRLATLRRDRLAWESLAGGPPACAARPLPADRRAVVSEASRLAALVGKVPDSRGLRVRDRENPAPVAAPGPDPRPGSDIITFGLLSTRAHMLQSMVPIPCLARDSTAGTASRQENKTRVSTPRVWSLRAPHVGACVRDSLLSRGVCVHTLIAIESNTFY